MFTLNPLKCKNKEQNEMCVLFNADFVEDRRTKKKKLCRKMYRWCKKQIGIFIMPRSCTRFFTYCSFSPGIFLGFFFFFVLLVKQQKKTRLTSNDINMISSQWNQKYKKVMRMDIVWHTFYGLQYVGEEKLAARPNKNYNNFYGNSKRTRHWTKLNSAEGDTDWERCRDEKNHRVNYDMKPRENAMAPIMKTLSTMQLFHCLQN